MSTNTTTSTKNKKQGLGRGMEALIPVETARAEPAPAPTTHEQAAGAAIGKVAMILSESLAGMPEYASDRMLRMIISLCQSEMKGGYRG